jgi:hypothetical protein
MGENKGKKSARKVYLDVSREGKKTELAYPVHVGPDPGETFRVERLCISTRIQLNTIDQKVCSTSL